MTKQKLAASLLVLALAASDVYLVLELDRTQKELRAVRTSLDSAQAKQPYVEFNQLFVDQVLRAPGEVSFDTRLQLENQVRSLGDAQVLEQWNKFVAASSAADAQADVKSLLGLLAERMRG